MPHKSCHKKINGVLQLSTSEKYYKLERAYPCVELECIVEQYWRVSWDLKPEESHTQINLPDPCAHLFFDSTGAQLLGAVSKRYSYELRGTGQVIGVKFKPSGLSSYTSKPLVEFVDKYTEPLSIFCQWPEDRLDNLNMTLSLDEAIGKIEPFLLSTYTSPSNKQLLTNSVIDYIKDARHITQVSQIAEHFNLSVRALQRLFERYVGLSPKWVIRKYRLHEVIDLAQNPTTDWLTMSLDLGYTDQAHFIKDFKDLTNMTPQAYLNWGGNDC